jgi:hypothetical protein
MPEPKSGASTNSATPAAGPPVAGRLYQPLLFGNPQRGAAFGISAFQENNMATVPPPSTIPETQPMDPGTPAEAPAPTPDTDVPDPGDPTETPE